MKNVFSIHNQKEYIHKPHFFAFSREKVFYSEKIRLVFLAKGKKVCYNKETKGFFVPLPPEEHTVLH